ncbi:MAG: hypothetical protein ABII01_06090 [Candidatus Woesearchaeota archaeon]
MWPFIIIFIIVILGMLAIFGIFMQTIIELILNIPLLVIVYYRARYHIMRLDRLMEYVYAAAITAIFFLIGYGFFKRLPFWPITSFLFITFLIAWFMISKDIKKKYLTKKSKGRLKKINRIK